MLSQGCSLLSRPSSFFNGNKTDLVKLIRGFALFSLRDFLTPSSPSLWSMIRGCVNVGCIKITKKKPISNEFDVDFLSNHQIYQNPQSSLNRTQFGCCPKAGEKDLDELKVVNAMNWKLNGEKLMQITSNFGLGRQLDSKNRRKIWFGFYREKRTYTERLKRM